MIHLHEYAEVTKMDSNRYTIHLWDRDRFPRWIPEPASGGF